MLYLWRHIASILAVQIRSLCQSQSPSGSDHRVGDVKKNEAVLCAGGWSHTAQYLFPCRTSSCSPWKTLGQPFYFPFSFFVCVCVLSGMEVTKGEERSAAQAASVFGTAEPESQGGDTGRGRKRSNRFKVIIAVLLLCLLIVIIAVALSLKNKGDVKGDGKRWLQEPFEEIEEPQCPTGFSAPPFILISLDGFRAQYLKDHSSKVPIINKLRKDGTTTPYMRPVYPTKTFPNHYSIVTGLYPESHGIVDNKMYDVTLNAFFTLKSEEKFNPKWYQGEPVWITAMRQKLKTGTYFWPGTDVAINGTLPDLYKKYDRSITFESRVSTLLDWLSLPEGERPDIYTLYLEEPDSAGHSFGTASPQVAEALRKVDHILGLLMDGLKQKNLHKCVNLLIISDHGMEDGSCEKAAFVSSYQSAMNDFSIVQGAAARIRPSRLPEGYFSFDYEGLIRNISCKIPDQPMKPYLKENLPKRFHFANNHRIERGQLYMKEGWQAAGSRNEIKYCTGGFHGSDNVFPNMQAIFIGYGPGFKSKTVVPPFENIELYNLICDLVNITPAPNNGTHGSLNHLLKHPVYLPVHPAQLSLETPCEASDPVPTDNLDCTCASQTKEMVENMNKAIITQSNDRVALRYRHHPFGVPAVVQSGTNFCLLHHSDYLNGYSKDRLMPLWVSYSIHTLDGIRPVSSDLEACVRADVRIPPASSQLCRRYRDDPSLDYGLLHPSNLAVDGPETDSLLTSNMVPMYPAFKDVWTHFHHVLLPKFMLHLNGVNIMSGPIFDEDYNGRADSLKAATANEAPIPTHFFVILTSCKNPAFPTSSCEGPLQASSFILPHRPDHTESCSDGTDLTWVEDWLQFHSARVRDIELLTGLSFYHDRISVEETLQLKTFLHSG